MSPETFDWQTLAARLGAALAAGAAIGWDRQRAGKSAGMRTHMLVSLGACVFALTPLGVGAGPEALSRTIQGIATGVGFLGGGVILHHSRKDERGAVVKGLTSAAAIWLTASLGIVAACGLWRTTLLASVAAIVVLGVMKPLEHVLFRRPPEDDLS